VKLFLIGRVGGITHWLEDAAAAFRAEGHAVRVGAVRRGWLNARIETAMAGPLADAMVRAARSFGPDLILAIGGFHVPAPFLDRLAAPPGRPPLVGWVGDLFEATAAAAAGHYDLVAYTDSGLMARHVALGFARRPLFLPHAASPAAATPSPPAAPARDPRMIFVGAATPGRLALVAGIAAPIVVHGPGWAPALGGHHQVQAARVAHRRVAGLYARHLAVLNIRNEFNVLVGLNQRSFDPYLSATPVVADDQADLERCFDPGREVLVYRDIDALNAVHERLRRSPEAAARIGEAGRRRVLAEHGFGHRLSTLMAAL
jgi:spore maturation protein CgeB